LEEKVKDMEEKVKDMEDGLISQDNLVKKIFDPEQNIGGLTEKLRKQSLDEDAFMNDDSKVLFYTGLTTSKLLFDLHAFVKPYLKHLCILTPFQQLLLTLMKLRLNLSAQDLAYCFNVHKSTVARTFLFVVDVLSV
jgi:hypothetical protein